MKKALFKDSVKEIKNTYKRFLSILLMAFLGVGFFAGIRATSPDMVDTIDDYYNSHNMYDIQIISTLGLTNDDIEEISKVENVKEVVGTYETDATLEVENKELVAKVMCIKDINKPELIEGKMPENESECVVELLFLTANNKKIGDTIELNIENVTNDDGEEVEYLNQKQLKIVGTVKSPIYLSRDRGTSSLGSGKIDYYIYINKNNIKASDVYTNIYAKVENPENFQTSSTKYEEYIENTVNNIEEIKDEREQARQNALIEKATKKVEDAENEFNTKKQEVETELNNARKEIENGKAEITTAENKIAQNEKTANKEFQDAENQIATAKAQITANEQELKTKEEQANTEIANAETQKNILKQTLTEVENGLPTAKETYEQIVKAIESETLPDEQKEFLEGEKKKLEEQIASLEENQKVLESSIAKIDEEVESAKKQIQDGKNQIETAKKEIETQEKTLNNTKNSTYAQINSAKKEVETSKQELANAEAELNTKSQEAETELANAEAELIDARAKISEIEKPTWYILDRTANSGYSSFIQDTESVENIGEVFPIVFFIVATLISLTSMTRMVEEQRTQIGTLKALGYNKLQIASKYIIYATLACVIGGILGMCVGFILLPKIIWLMYSIMYDIEDIIISFNWNYATIGLGLILICIVGSTIYAVYKELRQTPATLMRPKSPKMGKRVLLERIPFIWKHLKFSQKVTVRNIFRYKKRFLMTIIGILGCTALILTGFGLKDSISAIMPNQYEHVFNYDMQISLKSGLDETQLQEYITSLTEKEEIEKVVKTHMTSMTAKNNDLEEDVQIIIPDNPESLDGVINIADVKTKEKVELKENEICLTDKAAELLNVKAGDTITLRDSDGNEKQVKISNVVENYIYHYVYMTKDTYQNIFGETYETNVLLTQNTDLSEEQEEALATEIMNQSQVSSLTRISSAISMLDDTMSSLNYVVIILIVSAGLLAFVVLYNLSNVNISERIRELATIKVLGFYDKEVYLYITRETVILTIIGILLGLVGGYFLNYYIIGTCEINMLRFAKIILPQSYIYSVLITLGFTIIVNIVTYFALKKIDMIESLKSVE